MYESHANHQWIRMAKYGVHTYVLALEPYLHTSTCLQTGRQTHKSQSAWCSFVYCFCSAYYFGPNNNSQVCAKMAYYIHHRTHTFQCTHTVCTSSPNQFSHGLHCNMQIQVACLSTHLIRTYTTYKVIPCTSRVPAPGLGSLK